MTVLQDKLRWLVTSFPMPLRLAEGSDVGADTHNHGMVRPQVLADRLLNAHGTPAFNDELMTATAVALCAGPNGTARLLTELINRIQETK